MDDHYKTLGLRRDASKEDVKAAFARLALLHHPDRHPQADAATRAEATRRFRQAYEAYHVLRDDHRRAEYDLLFPFSSDSSGHGHAHCGAESRPSPASGGNGYGGASSSSSSTSNWPYPTQKGTESWGAWARANWYPLLCCTLRVVLDGVLLYNSLKTSRQSIQEEEAEEKKKMNNEPSEEQQ